MILSIFIQLLINSLVVGAIYALVASGFSLIYSVNKFVHFAHGATIAFSAYFLYYLFSVLGLNFGFSIVITVIFSSLFGYGMNYFVYGQLRKNKTSSVMLLVGSLGLLILIESLTLILFGSNAKRIGLMNISKGIELGGAFITPLQIVIIIVSILLLVGLFVFTKKTKLGISMRAVSDNESVAEIVGISSKRIYSWSFIIGSALSGVAAILIGLEHNLGPTMGTNLMIRGFVATIIGGIGSVYGAIFGAFLLGIVETFGVWYIPSAYKDAIVFSLLLIFLLFRPDGILGHRRKEVK
jgi:branched-chain amino acid transport system permease protein